MPTVAETNYGKIGSARLSSTFYNHAKMVDESFEQTCNKIFQHEKDAGLRVRRQMYLVRHLAGKHCSALLCNNGGAAAEALRATTTPERSAEIAAERSTALILQMFDGLLFSISKLGTGIGNGQQTSGRKAMRRFVFVVCVHINAYILLLCYPLDSYTYHLEILTTFLLCVAVNWILCYVFLYTRLFGYLCILYPLLCFCVYTRLVVSLHDIR